ncbi:MAG: 23S rRNA (adenine(2503)-C(2))-methyltransferase RlmN [Treponema sp.]|nr:23S rRNA (adenine(2503)-C(2))-methyltransferase RlmN [Treponema sp.]
MKQYFAGLSRSEINQHLSYLPGYRSKQIYKWIINGADDFEQMTDLPAALRSEISSRFSLFSSIVSSNLGDKFTKKIILTLYDESKIEAVLLNDGKKRFTACISTQVGCPAGCLFCKTGSLGFKRNLESFEIVEQFLHLKRLNGGQIDNIVIMGMGEPLLNSENLKKALEVLNDKDGLCISRRRITVSTCGIIEGIFNIANNLPFSKLALSLTTGDEDLRRRLMPISASNPLDKIKKGLILFQQNGGGRITLEIPLLSGINTRNKDAASIASFAKGLDYVVNLIPWNPVEGLEFEGSPIRECGNKETQDFIQRLETYGLKVTTRRHKGRSILGACGQLGE